MIYKHPTLTKEQKRTKDLKEIRLYDDDMVYMSINAAVIFFGTTKRTVERYLQHKLLNIFRMKIKGRLRTFIIVDEDFFDTGTDIRKYAGKGKQKS